MKFDTLQSLKDAKQPVIETPAIEYSVYTVTYIDGTTKEIGIPLSETDSFDAHIAKTDFSGNIEEYIEFNVIEL